MSRIHDAVLAFIVLFAEVGSHASEGGIEPLPRDKLLWRVGVAWQRWVDPHACVCFRRSVLFVHHKHVWTRPSSTFLSSSEDVALNTRIERRGGRTDGD